MNKLLFIMMLICAAPAGAAQFFVYEAPDGTRWITDHRVNDNGYNLVRRIGFQAVARTCDSLNSRTLAKRRASYEPDIISYAHAHHLDLALVKAVIHVESCFDPNAVSRAGAKGLMQLMPATARRFGVHNVYDPSQNVLGGTRYLKVLMEMFNYDKRLVLAAYNAGENAVKKYGGIPPYKETRTYVQRVLKFYEYYKQQG